MRSSRLSLLAVVLAAGTAALIGGCAQPANPINADALGPPLLLVLDRHDAYVIGDPGLENVEKTTFLRSSSLIRDTMNAAKATTPSSSTGAGVPAPVKDGNNSG